MNKIYYHFLILFAKLPFSILYFISDIFFNINYYFIGYRRETIIKNLKKSFPEKSIKELKKIQRNFYRNFSDYMVETIKLFHITKEELKNKHTFSGLDIITESKNNNKNIIFLGGHFFNWEYYIELGNIMPQKNTFGVYKKINNVFWGDVMMKMRSQFGTTPISMNDTVRKILTIPQNGEYAYLFISDQSPFRTDIKHEIKFLNQETPVLTGYDLLARRKNFDVIYLHTTKIKRGFYHTKFIKINPDQEQFQEYEIVNKFFNLLEKNIKEQPEIWLWSHKRWKYKKGRDY